MIIVMNIFKIIGIIIGAYVAFMLIVAITPGFSVPKQPLEKPQQIPKVLHLKTSRERKDVIFKIKGISLSAWLYLPENLSGPVPCIIMGHGLGATKEAGLESYAIRYQEAGFAVIAFDYRHLGESEGEPRQLIWIPYQQEDYTAAINYARSLKEIDSAKIALWGTSLSGGHVIVAAARDNKIVCVSAQCPLLDGNAGGMEMVKRLGIWYVLRMAFGHGLRDLVRSWLGLSPHKIPLVGKPGSIAVMADSDAWITFNSLMPVNFINEACARIIIRMDKYSPIKYVARVHCPVLLQVCDKDISLPMSVVEKAEKRLGKLAEVIHYPIDHFDIYLGKNFEKSVNDQLGFFKKHLF